MATQYYALGAKVRAMYGNHMTRDDYTRLAGMQNLTEMTAFLKGHPSYVESMGTLPSQDVTRKDLEDAIYLDLTNDYFRVLSFVTPNDVTVMRFLVLSMELREIMRFMRLAENGKASEYSFTMPQYFDRYSKIHYAQLSSAVTYSDMLDAVRQTHYYQHLVQLPLRSSGFPAYTAVESAIRNAYYRWVLGVIQKNYSGTDKQSLLKAVGIHIDIINVTNIIRVRRHFPAAIENIYGYLLPMSYKLKAPVVKALLSAADETAMLGVLRSAGYASLFTGEPRDNIDHYFYDAMTAFSLRELRRGKPYVGTAMAYIFLKELEISNLTSLIECVRYSVPIDKALSYLYIV